MELTHQPAVDYWFNMLKDEAYTSSLPVEQSNGISRSLPFTLSAETLAAFTKAGKGQPASLGVVAMAAWMVLLKRYGIAAPLLVTPALETGASTTTKGGLYFRYLNHAAPCFRSIIGDLTAQFKTAVKRQDYDPEQLKRMLGPVNAGRSYSLGFAMETLHENALQHDVQGLSLVLHPNGQGLLLYREAVLPQHLVNNIPGHFDNLLRALLVRPDVEIQELVFLSHKEAAWLKEASGAQPEPAPGNLLHRCFEETAEAFPETIAVSGEDISFTYAELNRKAEQAAACLLQQGLQPGQTVALIAPHDPLAVVCILAILKAGCAYLPIDPEYPEQRVQLMLEHGRAALLISNRQHPGAGVPVLDAATIFTAGASAPPAAPVNLCADAVAYIIFTSGSTGVPKGVPVTHRQACHLVQSLAGVFGFEPGLKFVVNASFSFDASVKEIFLPLFTGGTLYTYAGFRNINAFADYICDRGVEVMHGSPLFWQETIRALQEGNRQSALRYISSGGDVLSPVLAAKMRQQFPQAFFMNLYGPTEITINATYHLIGKETGTVIPVGKPLPGYRAFVLDAEGRLLPAGVAGELCIAGNGVTGGYLNNERATAKAFVRYAINGNGIVYRTGDKARWNAEGELEFLGRMDDTQLKIRGYRIEPGEIRMALESDPLVEAAYVLPVTEEDGDIVLVAYVQTTASINEIKKNLSARLPAYMVPGTWIPVEQFYKNSAGKTDTTRLPAPGAYSEQDAVPPATETEAKLLALWQKLFPKKKFGALDHFFDRGAHSIHALRLLTAITREMQVPVELKDIFNFPVLRNMAAYLDSISGQDVELIGKTPLAGDYPLSPVQQRLWILHQLEDGKAPYNISAGFTISGNFNEQALLDALGYIAARYEILRTRFIETGGMPRMQIVPVNEFQPLIESTGLQQETNAQQALLQRSREASVRPFNLAAAPPWKLYLFRMGDQETAGVFVFHHIITDGWSMDTFTSSLLQAYKEIALGKQPSWAPLPLQYKDYAAWMHASGRIQQSRPYWLSQFSDELPVTSLPADFARPAVRSYAGDAMHILAEQQLAKKLEQFCNTHHVTSFVVWLAAFRTLLYLYTGQEDHIIGIPVAGREIPGLEEQIGFFVNTLPIRTKSNDGETFLAFVQRIKEEMLVHYRHQHYPFDQLVDELKLERDTSRSPLFDILFGALPVPELFSGNELPGATIRPFTIETTTSKYDLLINILEQAGGFTIYAEYDTALFRSERIRRMMAHFLYVLEGALAQPEQPLYNLSLCNTDEQNLVTRVFNRKKQNFPKPGSLYALFSNTAQAFPARIAVKEAQQSYTYSQLAANVNRLAQALIAKGVQPGQPVALLMERTAWVQVSVLAIHKAGAYYVPVDTTLPADRITYILQDAGVAVALTNRQECLTGNAVTGTHIYDPEILVSEQQDIDDTIAPRIGEVAYMIYTSGSTGQPKGVLVTHAQVLNTLYSMQEDCPLLDSDTFLFKTNYAFDVSVAELFGWFIGGGSLAVLLAGDEKDPQAIMQAIDQYSITHINFVPSLFSVFFDLLKEDNTTGSTLKYIIVAGEAFPAALAADVCAAGWAGRVYNYYGPTEASIYATGCSLQHHDPEGPVFIGAPLHNVEVYILGANHTPVPAGIPGELCIAGPGVSNGYHNNKQLTAERFINNPIGEGKMYRSGDLARWTYNGQIEYLGRMDEQVKIRGYRIETGEIAFVLAQVPGVQQSIVEVKKISADNVQLIGYVTAVPGFDTGQALEALRAKLPAYMVPSAIIVLDAFPLNKSGKIDRKALPVPAAQQTVFNEYVAPSGALQEKIALLWSSILGVKAPGVHDNFFASGGNSLLAIRLNAAICREFKTGMSVKEIFLHPTIAGLSQVIGSGNLPTNIPFITPVAGESFPLSFAQERFWMIDKWGRGQAYHIPVLLQLSGPLNPEALQQAFTAMIQRHEPLRTVIKENRGIPCQVIMPATGWRMEYYEQQESIPAHEQLVSELVYRPFDLAADFPVRAAIIKKGHGLHTLAIVFHHIALDIWSAYLVANELKEYYRAFCTQQQPQLPPLSLRYADYAVWQRNYLSGSVLEQKAAYWVNRLRGCEPLQLPEDHARPAIQNFSGNVLRTVIAPGITSQLSQLAAAHNTTLFVALLAAGKTLLYRYTGQHDMAIGVPVANRAQQETEQMAGCFINTVVMRSQLQPGMKFTELLNQLNQTAMEAYAHQGVPFEYVLQQLDIRNGSPLFNVMFELQDIHIAADLELHDLNIAEETYAHSASLFDLSFSLSRNTQTNELVMDVEYSTELFSEATIARLVKHYTALLEHIVQQQHTAIGRLPLMDAGETRQLLEVFSGTPKEYPHDITVLNLFKNQVEQNPFAKAVVFNGQQLTYSELDTRAAQLAAFLLKQGVQPESLVVLYMERSLNLLVAILGILKAGAAYIPVDPAYPKARVEYMINDAAASFIVTDTACRPDIDEVAGRTIINMDADAAAIAAVEQPAQPVMVTPGQLAYVIYTSGSTGLPKGVMITHGNLLNIALNWRDHYRLDELKPVLFSIASVAFDVFTGDWCRTLANGGTMVIADNRNFDMHDFYTAMQQNGVNIMESTPSVVMSLTRYIEHAQLDFSFMKLLIIGSDILPAEQYTGLRERYGNAMRIINSYGVTEATIDSSFFEEDITHAGITPIGRPMNNIYYYILDELMNPVPVNIWGELYIGGAGVGRGYLDRAALTAEKFIPNPFMPGTALYKTGDQARWLNNGCVQFAGRNDDQVKIRGFRIEPGEIQNVLLQQDAIGNAVVTVQQDPANTQDKYLCAFYTVAAGSAAPSVEALRDYLAEKLPVFMMPDYFVCLDAIPLTVNNKVDKKALPFAKEHAAPAAGQTEPPVGSIETSLFEIWAEVLRTSRFGVTDNFFLVGGNSLKAVNVLSFINEAFMTDIKMKEFIADPVIRSLAVTINDFYEEQKLLFSEALDETIRPAG